MKSSNLNFVAACVSYGAEIIGTETYGSGKVVFELGNCPESVFVLGSDSIVAVDYPVHFDNLLNMFTSKVLMYPPNFPSVLRDIKSRLHD
jgi:hypothetical protein